MINLINLIAKTWRFETSGLPEANNFVIAFWHGKMLPVWYFFRDRNPLGIVSLSKDGEILSLLLKKWKYQLVRGSSSKRGKEVIEDTLSLNHQGSILITPDGPRGPNQEMKAGAIVISQKTNKPLILCNVKIKFKVILKKSWDNFEIPLPFSKIYLYFSEKISFDSELDYDLVRKIKNELTEKMNQLTQNHN